MEAGVKRQQLHVDGGYGATGTYCFETLQRGLANAGGEGFHLCR